jgi:hypothetical protein
MTETEQRVLREALNRVSFSLPQLAMYSGVGVEVAKEVVEREQGETIERSPLRTADGLVPGAEVWVVTDTAALEARLSEAADEEPVTVNAATPLAAAEDELLVALASEHPEDAYALAGDALARLKGAPPAPGRPEPEPASAPLVIKRNLRADSARTWIVEALAAYLMSDEAAALTGARWREAFRALAAVDLPDQAALQKRLVVELVRVADERAAVLRGDHGGPALVELLARAESIPALLQSGGPLVHAPVKAALVELLAQIRAGERPLDDPVTASCCDAAADLFRHDAEPPGALVQALRHLAFRPEEQTARSAQEALLALVQPRDASFWPTLAHAQRPAPLRLIFAGLSRFDVDAAFDHLEDLIRHHDGAGEVQAALVAVLPALEAHGSYLIQDRFAAFLAALPAEQRNVLMSAPALAGLTWSALALDRPLAQQFFSALTTWTTQLGDGHPAPGAQRQLDRAGERLRRIAAEAAALLSSAQREGALTHLRKNIDTKAGAAVAVPLLLAAGWESEMRQVLVELSRHETDASARIAHWYFEVCPQDKLEPEQLKRLLVAMYDAVQHDQRLLLLVAEWGAKRQFYVSEIFDNDGIDSRTRFDVETSIYQSRHGNPRPGLAQIAAARRGHAECIRG